MDSPSEKARKKFAGTGPYRRVLAKPGFTRIRSSLSLPTKLAGTVKYVNQGSEKEPKFIDGAHMYFGGVSTSLQFVDAGLMHNTVKDDWSLFFKIGSQPVQALPTRLTGNQRILLALTILGANHMLLEATDEKGETLKFEATSEDGLQGWNPQNPLFVLKRMTSIASNKPELVRPCQCLDVSWRDTEIGRASGDWMPYRSLHNDSMDGNADLRFHPNKNIVRVNFIDWGNETVSIKVGK